MCRNAKLVYSNDFLSRVEEAGTRRYGKTVRVSYDGVLLWEIFKKVIRHALAMLFCSDAFPGCRFDIFDSEFIVPDWRKIY